MGIVKNNFIVEIEKYNRIPGTAYEIFFVTSNNIKLIIKKIQH